MIAPFDYKASKFHFVLVLLPVSLPPSPIIARVPTFTTRPSTNPTTMVDFNRRLSDAKIDSSLDDL